MIIPARFSSTRLPGKPLLEIAGKPLIEHVVERANQSAAKRIIVATDDVRIENALKNVSCEVCMTQSSHVSGSDRLAEVVEKLELDEQSIIVNVQGDEPMIPAELINQVGYALTQHEAAVMSTAAHQIEKLSDIDNPNVVKVVFDQTGRAMYFSRSPIPYDRDNTSLPVFRHIGVYAYKAKFLREYGSLQASSIEQAESLEQLRVLDNGFTIMVETVDIDAGVGVDTQEDLELVRRLMSG